MKVEQNVRKLKKLLMSEGWKPTGEGKGSHQKFRKGEKSVTVPKGHNGELPIGTARQIAKKAGLI